VFRQYAKIAGVSPWAEECITELSGLREMTNSIRRHEAMKQAMQSMDRTNPDRPEPLSGKLPLTEVVRRSRRQQRYEERGSDVLRAENVSLDKAAHAIAVSDAYVGGELKSIAELGYNPMQPDPEKDSGGARLMRILSFLSSESNRNKGLMPPPAVTAAVDHVPFLEREKSRATSSAAYTSPGTQI
jgi:hypothetical protein